MNQELQDLSMDGEGFIKLFEEVISQDPAAFGKIGETVYQVTRTELIELAKRLHKPKKRPTWRTDGGYKCLNCGQVLTRHEIQIYCPSYEKVKV